MFWQIMSAHTLCSGSSGRGAPAECGSQTKSRGVSFSTVNYFWGSCAPAIPSAPKSCLAAIQWLSIPGPCGSNQTSPFTFTYCPHEFPHIYSQRDLCSLCQGLAGFWFLATPVYIRVLPALRPLSLVAKP